MLAIAGLHVAFQHYIIALYLSITTPHTSPAPIDRVSEDADYEGLVHVATTPHP